MNVHPRNRLKVAIESLFLCPLEWAKYAGNIYIVIRSEAAIPVLRLKLKIDITIANINHIITKL